MIKRFLATKLKKAVQQYPVLTLTGPRQSGKTTLVKMVFSDYEYVSLENPDMRMFAMEDPNGFLRQFQAGVILDEVQRTPDLLSYIQTIVDRDSRSGQFILTGSQNLLLLDKISQSLAGRTAVFHLMPFSQRENLGNNLYSPEEFPDTSPSRKSFSDLWETLCTGFYPRIHDKGLEAQEWLANYYQTYVERDVRLVINIGDMETFGRFVRLCAGRTGQLLNYSSLAADCGISVMTAKRWISVLQAGFIVSLVRPHYENFNKRLIKAPKMFFMDTGLLTFLLGVRNGKELQYHPLRGAVFESFVFSELYKLYLNNGRIPDIFYWQDVKRHEIDFILERGSKLLPIEVKSGETLSSDSFKGLKYYTGLAGNKTSVPVLIYGGNENYIRSGIQVLSWRNL